MPKPPAAFSPLSTTRSGAKRSRKAGSLADHRLAARAGRQHHQGTKAAFRAPGRQRDPASAGTPPPPSRSSRAAGHSARAARRNLLRRIGDADSDDRLHLPQPCDGAVVEATAITEAVIRHGRRPASAREGRPAGARPKPHAARECRSARHRRLARGPAAEGKRRAVGGNHRQGGGPAVAGQAGEQRDDVDLGAERGEAGDGAGGPRVDKGEAMRRQIGRGMGAAFGMGGSAALLGGSARMPLGAAIRQSPAELRSPTSSPDSP